MRRLLSFVFGRLPKSYGLRSCFSVESFYTRRVYSSISPEGRRYRSDSMVPIIALYVFSAFLRNPFSNATAYRSLAANSSNEAMTPTPSDKDSVTVNPPPGVVECDVSINELRFCLLRSSNVEFSASIRTEYGRLFSVISPFLSPFFVIEYFLSPN